VLARPDVTIVGGGVIGLSLAWELAGQGTTVQVLEQGDFGQQASWAGAGMLPPGNPPFAKTPAARLRASSHVLWEDWTARLREETGLDNGFRRCGGLEVTFEEPEDLLAEVSAWQEEGVVAEPIDREELHQQYPLLNPNLLAAYWLPEFRQVRNPRHLKALLAACEKRGVQLRHSQKVMDFERSGEQIVSLRTTTERIVSGKYVLTSGAWSEKLLASLGIPFGIRPIRGQMLLLELSPGLFPYVIQQGRRYLVPRDDGQILIGATEEDVGFVRSNTAEAVASLLGFAQSIVPALAKAKFVQCWSGLRPYSPSSLPLLSQIPGLSNTYVAAGHFRDGLQLSPITAVLMSRLLSGNAAEIPLECRLSPK